MGCTWSFDALPKFKQSAQRTSEALPGHAACAIWLPLDWRERWEAWLRQLRQKLLGRPQEPQLIVGRPTSSDSASSLTHAAHVSGKPAAFG